MALIENLCTEINRRVKDSSSSYEEDSCQQSLVINEYKPIFFSLEETISSIDISSPDWIREKHQSGRLHEPGTLAIMGTVRDSSIKINHFLDVGALFGYFSLVAANIFDEAEVYAFEANPDSFHALQKNLSLNQHLNDARVHSFNYVISNVSGLSKEFQFQQFSFRDSAYERLSQAAKFCTDFSKYSLKKLLAKKNVVKPDMLRFKKLDITSIDDFCARKSIIPNLIKIDVEGYQVKILPGAMKTLKRAKPLLLIEFDRPERLQDFGTTNKEIVEPLFDLGYQMIWGNHRNQEAEFMPVSYSELDSTHEINSLAFFFVEEHFK